MGRRAIWTSSWKWVVALTFLLLAIAADAMAKEELDIEAQRRAQIQKAQKTLAGTTWTVYTTLQDTKRQEEGIEVFTFTERRITTQNLAAQGYAAGGSNYSVYVETDGAVIWETMLRDEKEEGEVLLSGALRGNVMTGVIDIKPAKGARKIYYFTSAKEKPTAVTSTTTTTTTETKKLEKKRGWGR